MTILSMSQGFTKTTLSPHDSLPSEPSTVKDQILSLCTEKMSTLSSVLPVIPKVFGSEDKVTFSYVDKRSIQKELMCKICHDPLQDAVCHIVCKTTFCAKCLQSCRNCPVCHHPTRTSSSSDDEEVESEKDEIEQSDNTNLNRIEESLLPPSPALVNMLNRLHVSCNICSQVVQRADFPHHVENECPLACPHGCGHVLTRDELPHHLVECTKYNAKGFWLNILGAMAAILGLGNCLAFAITLYLLAVLNPLYPSDMERWLFGWHDWFYLMLMFGAIPCSTIGSFLNYRRHQSVLVWTLTHLGLALLLTRVLFPDLLGSLFGWREWYHRHCLTGLGNMLLLIAFFINRRYTKKCCSVKHAISSSSKQ